MDVFEIFLERKIEFVNQFFCTKIEKKILWIVFILYFCAVNREKSALTKEKQSICEVSAAARWRVKRESRANRELTRNCEVH